MVQGIATSIWIDKEEELHQQDLIPKQGEGTALGILPLEGSFKTWLGLHRNFAVRCFLANVVYEIQAKMGLLIQLNYQIVLRCI